MAPKKQRKAKTEDARSESEPDGLDDKDLYEVRSFYLQGCIQTQSHLTRCCSIDMAMDAMHGVEHLAGPGLVLTLGTVCLRPTSEEDISWGHVFDLQVLGVEKQATPVRLGRDENAVFECHTL